MASEDCDVNKIFSNSQCLYKSFGFEGSESGFGVRISLI